jgi:3-hydroxybutyrate dehydrogenase
MTTKMLSGKRALVTGSVQGIGLALATELAQAGADVVLHGLADPAAHEAARRAVAAAGGRTVDSRIQSLAHDLADPTQVVRTIDEILSAGPLDILVNNAGIRGLLREKQPSGRTSTPQAIARTVLWLCDPVAHNLTGAAIPVDGGWTAQ